MAEMPEFTISAVKTLRAFKPGDIVIIECTQVISRHSAANLKAYLQREAPEIKFVILDGGLRVVARSEIVEVTASGQG